MRLPAWATHALNVVKRISGSKLLGLEKIIVSDVEISHGGLGLCLSLGQGVEGVVIVRLGIG